MERYSRPQSRELSERALAVRLRAAGIPIETWGQGQAKTIDDLAEELRSGETRLTEGSNGEIIREVSVVFVDVFATDRDQQLWHLREERQVFSDGRQRQRNLLASLGEKMKPDEQVAEATQRAIAEELGIDEPITSIYLGSERTVHASTSYPGLQSHFNIHRTAVILPEHVYRSEGYQERQSEKVTYFVWECA